MNILQVIPSLAIVGGAEVLVVKIAIFLKELGHNVTILCFAAKENQLVELLRKNNIEIVIVPKKMNLRSKKMNLRYVFYSPYNFIFTNKYIKNHNFDIVHAHLFPARLCMAMVRLIYKNKIPLVATEHSTYDTRRRKIIFKLLNKISYSQFDKIVAVSQSTKDALVKWIPNTNRRCLVIYNGINNKEFDTIKKEKDKKQELVVMLVGNFTHAKGHDILLRAFALTKNMKLYLVGEGKLQDEIKELARKLNIADRVYFLGNRQDVASLLASVDIYVQSSLWEGFGIAVVEAMAVGLPIIVSDVPSLSEVVGEAGMTFPCGNVNKLADTLMLLASNKELRDKLSILAKKRSLLFSLEKTVKEHLSLYNTMLKEKAGFIESVQ